MKRSLYILILLMAVCSSANGRRLMFENDSHIPISDVRCTGFSLSMDSICFCISDANGLVEIKDPQVVQLLASHPDYGERLLTLSALTTDTVTLNSPVSLREVTVTPSDVEEFATHTSYRIPRSELDRYSNTLQSLNAIPNLTVLSNGAVFFEGEQNVKILVDGVEASLQEIRSIAKADIAKVNVYGTPPPRFIAQGVASVIDIRLKSKLHGGNGAIDVSQAFHPIQGNNSAAMYYNYRRSRFSLIFSNENRHYRKIRQSESLEYTFGGIDYQKTKTGLDSSSDLDENDLQLAYQVNRNGSFLYQVKAGGAINRNGRDFRQIVKTGDAEFPASNYLHTGYTRYNLGNYFEKEFPNGGAVLGNINFRHLSTTYESRYRETGGHSPELDDSHSRYRTGMDGLLSEFQYQFPRSKVGIMSVSISEVFHRSSYADSEVPFHTENNITSALLQWVGWKKKVQWFAMLGMEWFYTGSSSMVKSSNLVMPFPMFNLTWRPRKEWRLMAEYSLTGSVPSIAQLSESAQWLDTRLVYHGNATLKPYRSHTASVRAIYGNKYIDLSVKGTFKSSPGMICDMYTATDAYMLQTLVNLARYREWGAQTDITVKPLGDNRIAFWNRLIASDVSGSNNEYRWHGYRFQWMSNLSFNLKHWTAEFFYQYPGRIAEGQLIRPRAQCWSATLLYRPVSDLSFGLEWFMPFGKGLKESERTVATAPVHADTEVFVRDRANMVSLKLSYNFSFGRNQNRAQPQYDNVSNDTGILTK